MLSELRASVLGIGKKVNDPESLLPPGYIDFCMRRTGEMQSEMKSRVRQSGHELAMLAHLLRDDKKLEQKKDKD